MTDPVQRAAQGGRNLLGLQRRDEQLARNSTLPLDSPMPRPNLDTMSVRQLIDIVAFLDSKYELAVADYQ